MTPFGDYRSSRFCALTDDAGRIHEDVDAAFTEYLGKDWDAVYDVELEKGGTVELHMSAPNMDVVFYGSGEDRRNCEVGAYATPSDRGVPVSQVYDAFTDQDLRLEQYLMHRF